MTHTNIPIACELPLAEQEDARKKLGAEFFPNVEELREHSDGYELRFAWNRARLVELGDFLSIESDCCPFIRFELIVESGRKDIWLKLCGPGKTKAALKDELQPLLPRLFAGLPSGPRARISLSGAGLSVLGIGAALCCATPLIGLLALGTLGTFFNGGALIGLAAGAVLLGAGLYRFWYRKKTTSKGGCAC